MIQQLTLGIVAVLAVVVGALHPVEASGPPQATHRGTGRVVAVSPARIIVAEAGGPHPMAVDSATRFLIDEEAQVSRVGLGDYVAEECVPGGTGASVKAVRIALYRPAWMELATPEY